MSPADPPKPSPRVPSDEDRDELESSTGVFPATRAFTRWVGWLSTLRTLAMIVVAIGIGAVLGWERLGAMAEARGAARCSELEPRVTATEQLRVEVYDMRKDLRSFYDWQTTGRPMMLPPLPPPPPPPGAKDSGR